MCLNPQSALTNTLLCEESWPRETETSILQEAGEEIMGMTATGLKGLEDDRLCLKS